MLAPIAFFAALASAESWQCYGHFGCVLKHDAADLLHGRYESKEACEKVCKSQANEDVETCLASGNLGCMQADGACNYEKCTPCCAGLICYHDQDAGDMCMKPPPAADTAVLSAVAQPLLSAKMPLCNPKFACCTRGADFCRAKDANAYCDPTVARTTRAFAGGCACPYGTHFSKKAQKCVGGEPPAPGPTPGGPYCVHDAPQNACAKCATPEDCGGNKTDWSLCWANIDEKCTDSDAELVKPEEAETCMASGNLGCRHADGSCFYEKGCTPCCPGLICYHDQDAGDMCIKPPPVLYA